METDLRHWIIRAEIRCAVDLPPSKYQSEFSKLPSTFVETGWTIYSERAPDNQSLHITQIVNNENNPIFNESFVVEPPKSVHSKDGFLYVAMQDKNVYSENVPIYIPLSTMTSFLPYHFEITTGKDDSDYQGIIYLSLVLEEVYSDNFLDTLVSFNIYSIVLEPFPFKIKTLYIVVTTDEYEPEKIPYIRHNVNQSRNISQSVVEYSIKNERIWISPIIRIPSTKKKGEPECEFMMLKSMLSNKVSIYLMARDDNIPTIHPLPNTFIGAVRNVDMSLKTLL